MCPKRFTQLTRALLIVSGLWLAGGCQAEKGAHSRDDRYAVEQVAKDLGVVWGMVFLSPAQLLFTERDGDIGLLTLGDHRRQPSLRYLSGAPEVWVRGQGGLLDVAVAPGYQSGDWIYFTYSKDRADGAATTLARARLGESGLTDWSELLVTRSSSATSRHFGSRIAFDDTGYLYFGVGDRGVRPNGQNLGTHAGSILRLHPDGQVPADNPFAGDPAALSEIWSYGHRNPQGLCFDRRRKILWAGEHGPRGGDEINRILAGRNYGWAEVSHGKEYASPAAVGEATERADVKPALRTYIPSIAPGSLLCYDGERFPELRGHLLQGSLKLTHLNLLRLDEAGGQVLEERRLLQDTHERLRSLAQSPDGDIYLGTDSGRILRLTRSP